MNISDVDLRQENKNYKNFHLKLFLTNFDKIFEKS